MPIMPAALLLLRRLVANWSIAVGPMCVCCKYAASARQYCTQSVRLSVPCLRFTQNRKAVL